MLANRILAGTLGACLINAGTVNANVITTGTMNAARITAGTMAAERIYGGTLGACLINAGTVNANAILAGTLVADTIAARSLYGIKIGTGNTNGIETANIVDYSVIIPSFATQSGTLISGTASQTVLSTSLTTHGSPVLVSYTGNWSTNSAADSLQGLILRDASPLAYSGLMSGILTSPVGFNYFDNAPASGTYTYSVALSCGGTAQTSNTDKHSLYVMEIRK
jgi:hypothetical protein